MPCQGRLNFFTRHSRYFTVCNDDPLDWKHGEGERYGTNISILRPTALIAAARVFIDRKRCYSWHNSMFNWPRSLQALLRVIRLSRETDTAITLVCRVRASRGHGSPYTRGSLAASRWNPIRHNVFIARAPALELVGNQLR